MYVPLFLIILLAYSVIRIKYWTNLNKTEVIVYTMRSTATATAPMDPEAIHIRIQFTPKQIVHHRRIAKTVSMPNLHLGPPAIDVVATATATAAAIPVTKKTQ
jgi:hypothetical protein